MTRDILDTTDPILNRVPRKLREEYMAGWDRYQSTCVTGGTPEQRAFAFENARRLEERFNAAVIVASSEEKRATAKKLSTP